MAPPEMDELPVVLIGAGDAGIDEMRPFVQDTAVQWALLRFELGEGSFKRQKILFVHVNGDACPALARGRANQLTGDVKQALRGEGAKDAIHASVEVKKSEELRAEVLLERVARFFITDDKTEFSVQWMLKEYERQLQSQAKSSGKTAADGGGSSPSCQRIPSHRSQLIFTTGRDALKAVGEPLGPWNWVMLQADPQALELVEGGEDSIDGMQCCIESHADLVMFGILRMGFGEGRLRRTKYVFVHANGAGVSAVARGQLGSHRPKMQEALGQFGLVSVSVEINDPQDLRLEDIIERVRKAAIIDDDVLGPDGASKSIFTVEAFRQALQEEQVVTASFHEEDEEDEVAVIPGSFYTVPEAVHLMRAQDAPLNWALFGPNPIWIRQRKSMQAPPTVGMAAVPIGGYVAAAKRRASSEGPARTSVASIASEHGEEEVLPDGQRVSIAQRVSVFGGGAHHRSSSAVPLGSHTSTSSAAPPVQTSSFRSAVGSPRRSSGGSPTAALGSPRRSQGALPSAVRQGHAAAGVVPAALLPAAPGAHAGGGAGHAAVGVVPTALLPASPTAAPVAPSPAAAAQMPPRRARLAGPLLKQSGAWLRGWQLRWFEVGQGGLRWWDSPDDAARGKECKGCQQLVGMKVKMVSGSTSQFTLATTMGKDKTYLFDANASVFVGRAGWGLQAAASSVQTTAGDWIKALEREAIERRKTSSFSGDAGRALLHEALSPG